MEVQIPQLEELRIIGDVPVWAHDDTHWLEVRQSSERLFLKIDAEGQTELHPGGEALCPLGAPDSLFQVELDDGILIIVDVLVFDGRDRRGYECWHRRLLAGKAVGRIAPDWPGEVRVPHWFRPKDAGSENFQLAVIRCDAEVFPGRRIAVRKEGGNSGGPDGNEPQSSTG